MEKELNQGLAEKELREVRRFGYSFAFGMAILLGLSFWRHFALPVKVVVSFLCLYHLIFALTDLRFLLPSYKGLTWCGRSVGNVLTFIVFTAVFYLLFTPLAVLLRLLKKDVIGQNSVEPRWTPYPESASDPRRVEKLF